MAAIITEGLIPIREYASKLDKRKSVTQDAWAVTIIKVEGVVQSHAELFIEGVNKQGEYFATMAHLCGRKEGESSCHFEKFGEVKIRNFRAEEEIKWGFKSKTSVITYEQGNDLLHRISEDILNNENNPVPFHILGSKSIFVKKVKCYETLSEELLKIKREEPPTFFKLCKKFEANRTGESDREKLILDLMKKHLTIVRRKPHSCITWAKDKLSTIGLELSHPKPFDSIITVTAFHTT